MYTRQEASLIRKNFWTSFGRYMKPLPGADGGQINWLNYKTGVKHLYFRMDADTSSASIYIEIADSPERHEIYQRLLQMSHFLSSATNEEWNWEEQHQDENGAISSRIGTILPGVNIFRQADWPDIISFLKPRIIALDNFWSDARYSFQ